MIAFIVPIRSKKTATNWYRSNQLLVRTLGSISNQTGQEYKVLVIGHEVPEDHFKHPKVSYHVVDFPPPVFQPGTYKKTGDSGEDDKARKLLFALGLEEMNGVDWVMPVDSDDLISNRIAEFLSSNGSWNNSGWYFKKGYLYPEGSKYLFLNKENFNFRCGTCIITKPDLLPLLIETIPSNHFRHEKIRLNQEYQLHPFPFPAALYSIANGQNHFMTKDAVQNLRQQRGLKSKVKDILRKLKKYNIRLIGSGFRKEFAFYRLS